MARGDGEGGDYFKYFRQRGAINRGTAIINLRKYVICQLKKRRKIARLVHYQQLTHASSLRKHRFLLALRRWGRFARRNAATQRRKFHTDDANQCLHNKSCSYGVPNINLSNLTCLLVDFGSVLFICQQAPAKLKCFIQRRLYSTNIDSFVRDSSRLYLTFVAFCLLSVIREQQLKKSNYSVDQSALLTGFRTDFTSSVWNFCR